MSEEKAKGVSINWKESPLAVRGMKTVRSN